MKFALTEELRKIISNAGWLFFEKALRIFPTIYVVAMLARYLGPEKFGVYNYVFSFVILFFPFLNLSANSILVKELIQTKQRDEVTLGSAFILRFTGSLLAILTLNFIAYFKNIDNLEIRVLILIMSFDLLIKSFEVLDSFFQSKVESKYAVISKSIAFFIASALRITFIALSLSINFFVICFLVESFLYVMGFIFFYKRKFRGSVFSWKVNLTSIKKIMKESLPLIFTGIAVSVFMNIDVIMLKEYATDYAVGVYSVAVKMSNLWHFLPMAIVLSLFPSIIKLRDSDNDAYWKRIKKVFTLMTYLAIGISVTITFISGPVINFLFSSKYADSIPVLNIHIWSSIFVFWGFTQHAWDVAEKMLNMMLIRTLFAACLNIVLNYFFIQKWGAIGAAWATLISQASVIFMNIIHKKTREILWVELTSFYYKS